MKSEFYYGGHHKKVAANIKNYLIEALRDATVFSPQTVQSPRAVGDAIESLIANKFDVFLGQWNKEYSKEFARRAMADIAFTDTEGIYSIVDVKTHRIETSFNRPNLTSVERLSRFYESDSNVFSILIVTYTVKNSALQVTDVVLTPIEFVDWNSLTVGALGWGQIQISDSNKINVHNTYSRRKWMLQFCDTMMDFYPKEIGKMNERMGRFKEVKKFWESKEDIWV